MRRYPLLLLTLIITLLPWATKAKAQADLSSPIIPVTELRDVQPADWAFSALQQLQNRYQCILGYPDPTFRGEQAMTRYEFAALLNRCLTQLEANLTSEEQAISQQLQVEFTRELSIVRGRVDVMTARVRELEITQFSTTTKLRGVVNFALTNSTQSGSDSGVTLQGRSRLDLKSSLTGKDLFLTRLTAGNAITPDLANKTPELTQTQQWRGNTDNNLILSKLTYQFPLGDKAQAMITPIGGQNADYNTPAVNPFLEDDNAGTTTLSTFGQRNPILSLGGGTGVAFSYAFNDSLELGLGYYTREANHPETGLFNGSYTVGTRLKWAIGDRLSLGINYLHSFFQEGEFGFTDGLTDPSNIVGTTVVNETLSQFPTVTNAYGIELFWEASPKLAFGGRLGYTDVQAIDQGDGEIWNYSLSIVFPDLGQINNLGGIIMGAQPYLGSLEGVSSLSNDIPWHIEGFYRWQVNDHVSLTPGLIWHLNPNQDQGENDIVTSTMRMTLTF